MVNVSRYGAEAYAQWARARLPTEAEWEKAARGGLSGLRFPWGDLISETNANYFSRLIDSFDLGPSGFNPIGMTNNEPPDGAHTSPVGSFAPNSYGLYDMAGNVCEWCWDWRGTPYGQPTATNPTGAATGSVRVLRGGYWAVDPGLARCCYRGGANPATAMDYRGLRCVRRF